MLFLFLSVFLSLICLTCVTTSIWLSLLSTVYKNNSVLDASDKTMFFPCSQSINCLYWHGCLSVTVRLKHNSQEAMTTSL